jgi:hypothetical protein
MVRQITLNAIRGSRLCVVVLSAIRHSPQSVWRPVRMIANIPSRDVIISSIQRGWVGEVADEVPEIPPPSKTIGAGCLDRHQDHFLEVPPQAHHSLNNDLNTVRRPHECIDQFG